ncbi:universal stress protein [Myxococcus sp. AM001]|uniref:universal stress protein n=1 Tax=Myxococcus vastator TaxID=2709664 RepID=UPI0013D1E582|nr:universal stress protein [Myxococcus vastator]NVJ10489.1 universal stress protein [Myxococcus sp. AM001]
MSIVCATNFSDAARRASTLAAELARKAGTSLWLVHVLNPDSVRAFGQALLGSAEAVLSDETKRLEKLGAKVEPVLLTGEPAVMLEAFCREQRASLVVASRDVDESPFGGEGGTVDRMAQSLTVPLLVMRDPAPLEAWARGARPLKVLLGVDRSLPFEAARDWVLTLRKGGRVDVVGGRVYWPEEEARRLGLRQAMAYGEAPPELQQALERESAELLAPLADAGAPVRVRVEAGVGRIADHLVELAEQEQVDLMVVGTHHRRAMGRLWSVSRHVLRLARMSVVCVPSQAMTVGVDTPLPEYREVMVATDFSETGNRAVAHACALTSPGGTVHLVHATESKPSLEEEAQLREQLSTLVPKGARDRNVRLEVIPGGKDVVATLAQTAERLGVSAIVMGTHGRSGWKRAVLGSVTQSLLVRTDRPVLVVRPPAT